MRHWLFDIIRAAFLSKPVAKSSKHHAIGDDATGPEAADVYRARRNYRSDSASSLKKLQREFNIAAGLRPLRYDVSNNRERKIKVRAAMRANRTSTATA